MPWLEVVTLMRSGAVVQVLIRITHSSRVSSEYSTDIQLIKRNVTLVIHYIANYSTNSLLKILFYLLLAVDGEPAEDGVQPVGHQRPGDRLPGEGAHQSAATNRSRREDTSQETLCLYFVSVSIHKKQTLVSPLEELSPIPTLKTTCENHRRRKNVARVLASTDLASTNKRIVNGSRRKGIGARRRATTNASKRNASCICPVWGTKYYNENRGQEKAHCCGSSSSWLH
ncbi:hypothetical protein TNCV_2826481 [Trichonephila clavipes]|nr:hypothetical protein TNCV_2826481 [Trichonephila clavipes]